MKIVTYVKEIVNSIDIIFYQKHLNVNAILKVNLEQMQVNIQEKLPKEQCPKISET